MQMLKSISSQKLFLHLFPFRTKDLLLEAENNITPGKETAVESKVLA